MEHDGTSAVLPTLIAQVVQTKRKHHVFFCLDLSRSLNVIVPRWHVLVHCPHTQAPTRSHPLWVWPQICGGFRSYRPQRMAETTLPPWCACSSAFGHNVWTSRSLLCNSAAHWKCQSPTQVSHHRVHHDRGGGEGVSQR